MHRKQISRRHISKELNKFHPDVNKQKNAEEVFAEFNEAYQTLSDENKKQIYDSTGMTGDEQAQAGAGQGGPFGGGFPGGFGGQGGGSFWDQFTGGGQGPGAGNRQGGMPGGGFEDMFGDFEDFFNMGGSGSKKRGSGGAVKGRDVIINATIDFMEAVNGSQKTVRYQKIDD